jgi:NADP-reducing hydrogenase subunit HndB
LGEEPITYEYMDENKMRQVFKQHIIGGKVQRQFVLAKGLE